MTKKLDLEQEIQQRLDRLKDEDQTPTLQESLTISDMILSDEMQLMFVKMLSHRHFNIAAQTMQNQSLDIEEFRVKQGEFLGIEHAIEMMLSFALILQGYREEEEEIFNDNEESEESES